MAKLKYLSWDSRKVMRMTEDDLDAALDTMIPIINKRVRALSTTEHGDTSPALINLNQTDFDNLSKNYEELTFNKKRELFAISRQFLDDRSASVQGWGRMRREMRDQFKEITNLRDMKEITIYDPTLERTVKYKLNDELISDFFKMHDRAIKTMNAGNIRANYEDSAQAIREMFMYYVENKNSDDLEIGYNKQIGEIATKVESNDYASNNGISRMDKYHN